MTTALDQTNTVRPIRVRRGQRAGRVVPVTLDADPESLRVATGTADPDLALQLLGQALNATPAVARSTADTDVGTAAISATLAAVAGIKPRDPLEGMLAVQMAAVHNLAMEMAQRALLPGQTPEGVDMNVSRATRLVTEPLSSETTAA